MHARGNSSLRWRIAAQVSRLGLSALALILVAWSPAAQANEAPITEKWAPTKWGANDQLGAPNMLNEQHVLDAAKLIRKGKTATLGKVYQTSAPAFGARYWKLVIPGMPTSGPDPFGAGKNDLVYNDEFLSTEVGQIGTQFDGLGHIGVRTSKGDFFYNGNILSRFGTAYGLTKLGIEHIGEKGFTTRGVLADVAGYRGVDRLPIPKGGMGDPGIVTAEELQAVLKKQGVEDLRPGDILLIHTGHGKYWGSDWDSLSPAKQAENKAAFNSGEPGPGLAACKWMISKGIVMVGSDTWATEAVPGEDPGAPFTCHQEWMTRNGVYNFENLDLSALVDQKVYEFMFVWAPLKMKGATGSPGNPIVIW
jgi:kynurenine formamidase